MCKSIPSNYIQIISYYIAAENTIDATCKTSNTILEVTVNWQIPGSCVQNSTVSWVGQDLWQDETYQDAKIVSTDETTVDDPQPYTEYTVTVEWKFGSQSRKDDCTATTKQTSEKN